MEMQRIRRGLPRANAAITPPLRRAVIYSAIGKQVDFNTLKNRSSA